MERLQQLTDELSVELQSHELQKVNLSDKFQAELARKEVSLYLFLDSRDFQLMWFKRTQAIASMSIIILILYVLPAAMLFALVRCVG